MAVAQVSGSGSGVPDGCRLCPRRVAAGSRGHERVSQFASTNLPPVRGLESTTGSKFAILTFDGVLDHGFRVSVVDATLDDDDVGATPGGTDDDDGFIYYNIYIPDSTDPPDGVEFGDGEASCESIRSGFP